MTIRQAYLGTVGYLRAYGVESPEFDASQLVESVTGVSRGRMPLDGQKDIPPAQWKKLRAMIDRRAQKYPLQYLLGEWEFFGLPFSVGEGVLIPRPDTETLVETGLKLLEGVSHPVVYDLCSGSGCIAAAVASQRPDALIYAVEVSQEAFSYLTKNTRPFPGVRPVLADIFEAAPQLPSCHLILSNPPYLSDEEMNRLQTEVTYEPEIALRAGENGLAFYRSIAKAYRPNVLPQGHIAFEVGYRQSGLAEELLRENGWRHIEKKQDLNGIERVVYASA